MPVKRKMNSHSSEFRNAFRDTILRIGYDGIKNIAGTDAEIMLLPLLSGHKPKGKRNSLADIANDAGSWSVKTMYYSSQTEDYADIIMARVSTLAAANLSDPLRNVDDTAAAVTNEWNRRVAAERDRFGDIRTLCLLRHSKPRKVTLFEAPMFEITPQHRWILRPNKTFAIGGSDGRQMGIWQPTGGQLRFLYDIPLDAITVELGTEQEYDEKP